MGTSAGPNIERDGLVFGYDTGYPMVNNDNSYRFNKGQTTENLIYDMGGTVTSAYPEVVYQCTAKETNVTDKSAPGGKYSRFIGNSTSDNQQIFSRFSSYSIDVRGDSVNYSVYLKGSGTCHLTIYDNQNGYGISSTITLTDDWVRYNYTRTVNASATSYWVAVRGVLNTTDVYIAGQQATRGTHSTPYVEDNRSSTQSLIDLKETTNIDVSGISFDSNAQITFDGTDDEIIIAGGTGTPLNFTNTDDFTMETWVKIVSMPASGNTMGIFVKAYKVGIDLYYPTVNTMVFRCGTRNSQQSIVSQTGGYTPLGVWSHVVFTYESNSSTGVKLYINGVFNNSVSNTSQDDFSNNTNYTIGGNEAIAGTPKFGNINSSVAKMYNKALSAEEVKQNFNASKKRFGL